MAHNLNKNPQKVKDKRNNNVVSGGCEIEVADYSGNAKQRWYWEKSSDRGGGKYSVVDIIDRDPTDIDVGVFIEENLCK